MRTYEEMRATVRPVIERRDLSAITALSEEMSQSDHPDAAAWIKVLAAAASRELRSAEAAMSLYQEALDLAAKSADAEIAGTANTGIGLCLHDMNRLKDSIQSYERAEEVYSKAGDQSGASRVILNQARAWSLLGDLTRAHSTLHRAEQRCLESGNRNDLCRTLTERARLMYKEARREEALEILHQAHHLVKDEADARPALTAVYDFLALIYFEGGEQSSALEYYLRSLEVIESIPGRYGVGTALSNLGMLLRIHGPVP